MAKLLQMSMIVATQPPWILPSLPITLQFFWFTLTTVLTDCNVSHRPWTPRSTYLPLRQPFPTRRVLYLPRTWLGQLEMNTISPNHPTQGIFQRPWGWSSSFLMWNTSKVLRGRGTRKKVIQMTNSVSAHENLKIPHIKSPATPIGRNFKFFRHSCALKNLLFTSLDLTSVTMVVKYLSFPRQRIHVIESWKSNFLQGCIVKSWSGMNDDKIKFSVSKSGVLFSYVFAYL